MPAKLVRTPESSSTMAIEIGMAKRLQMAKRDVNTSCDRQTFCGCDFQGLGREWHLGVFDFGCAVTDL